MFRAVYELWQKQVPPGCQDVKEQQEEPPRIPPSAKLCVTDELGCALELNHLYFLTYL